MEKKAKYLLILLLGLGFALRVWRLRELMGFDYDQEVAAQVVERIRSGDLTLIGQETSTPGIFIAPGYYYFLAGFSWLFRGDPVSAGVMVSLISILTMIVLFLLVRERHNTRAALFALAIYATSARINFYDRTTAPSNPLLFASVLSLYLLRLIRRGATWATPVLTVIVAFAVLHLHPSAVGLIPLILVLWKLWRLPRPTREQTMQGVALALLVASPLILFELRHQFLISKNLLATLGTKGDQAYAAPFKLLLLLRVQFELLASLIAVGKAAVFPALTILIVWSKRASDDKAFLISWLLLPPLVLSFWTRHIPEYYLLISLPAWIFILASLISQTWNRPARGLAIILVSLIVAPNLLAVSRQSNPLGLKNKMAAIEYISRTSGGQAAVSFDTDLGQDSGFRYLAASSGLRLADDDHPPTHTIVVPPDRRLASGREVIFGGVKVIESVR